METRNKRIIPVTATHPGRILKRELEERGITQKDFAKQIGVYASNLNDVIKGKRNINKELAQKLENALGIEATFWIGLQNRYFEDIKLIKQREQSLQETKTENTSLLQELIKMREESIRMTARLDVLIAEQQNIAKTLDKSEFNRNLL
ncbi:MAG: HigA family addiction module antidote protein [Bacteroidales bacterium]|nr:HigA family addiction module antidote protein [Bacteroidales bacterium]